MVNYKDIVDSSQLDAATTSNPDGTFQDYEAGLKPGTPIIKSWFQTPYYFFRRLIFEGLGVVPNGNIDTMTENQAFDALEAYTKTKVSDRTDILDEQIEKQNVLFNYDKYDVDKLIDKGAYTDDVTLLKFGKVFSGVTPISTYVTCGVDNPIAGTTWVGCALNGDLKVAIANGKMAYQADSSSSWVSQNITGDWKDVIYSEYLGLFIAVKDSAYSTSSDGVTWTDTALAGAWTHLTTDEVNGYILLTANDGSYTYSSNLSVWQDGSVTAIDKCFAMNGRFYVFGDFNLYKGVFQSGGLAFDSIVLFNYSDPTSIAINPDTNAIMVFFSGAFGNVMYLTDANGLEIARNTLVFADEATDVDFKGFLWIYGNDGELYKL